MTADQVEALIRQVSAVSPAGERVYDAFRAVPRHLFAPPVGLVDADGGGKRVIDRDADPQDWLRAVYLDTAIVSQLDDGATDIRTAEGDFTSSASAPGTVADLLEWLSPEPGQRVLEVGTGTGWTAALLSHLVGPAGAVTSIEVDRAARRPEDKHWSETDVDPRTLAYAPAGAGLAISALTGAGSVYADDRDEDGEVFRLWLSDPVDPHSWGTVEWRPGETEHEVYQVGDRPLWDEVTDAFFRWVSWGEPGPGRFGMTVTPDGQRVWLDTPDHVL